MQGHTDTVGAAGGRTPARLSRRKALLADAVLLSVAAFWGGNFVLIKLAVERTTAIVGGGVIAGSVLFLMLRYVVATGVLAAVRPRSWLHASRRDWGMGGLLGVFYVIAISLQVIGIHGTSPGVSGFIVSLATALVPFLYWAVAHRSPGGWQIAGALVATVGLALLSLRGGFRLGWGEAVTLLSALFYALHIMTTGLFAPKVKPATLAFTQLAVAAGALVVITMAWVNVTFDLPWQVWAVAVWTAVSSSVYGIVAESWAQRYTTSTHAGIILAFESVFAAAAGVVAGMDAVTWRLMSGGSLLLAGVLIVELLPSSEAIVAEIEAEEGVPVD